MDQTYKVKSYNKLTRRNRLFLIVGSFNYILLALVDAKNILLKNYEQWIYRDVLQQIFITIMITFVVSSIFNENTLEQINSFFIIYNKKIKDEIYTIFFSIIWSNVAFFLIGQILSLVINAIMGKIYLLLWIVNIITVILEMIICILFVMGIRMLFEKDIIVFTLFYLMVLTSIISNNVFISMPLTMNIVGIKEQGFYVSFGMELWIGRIFLLVIAFIIFNLGIKRYEKLREFQ